MDDQEKDTKKVEEKPTQEQKETTSSDNKGIIAALIVFAIAAGIMTLFVKIADKMDNENTSNVTNTATNNTITEANAKYLCLKADQAAGTKVTNDLFQECPKGTEVDESFLTDFALENLPDNEYFLLHKGEANKPLSIEDIYWVLKNETSRTMTNQVGDQFTISVNNKALYIKDEKNNKSYKIFDKEAVKSFAIREVCCAGSYKIIVLTENGNAYISAEDVMEVTSYSEQKIVINFASLYKGDIVAFYEYQVYDPTSTFVSNIICVDKDGRLFEVADERPVVQVAVNANNCTDNIFELSVEHDIEVTGLNFNGKTNTFKYTDGGIYEDKYRYYLNDKPFYEQNGGEPSLYMVCSYDNYIIASMSLWSGYPYIRIFDKNLKMVYEDEGDFEYKDNLLYISSPEITQGRDYFDLVTYTVDLKNNSFKKTVVKTEQIPMEYLD